MSGETWPKESQRLRNGANGQVPVGGSQGAEDFEEKARRARLATEIDYMWLLDVAVKHVGFPAKESRFTETDRGAMLVSLVLLDGFRGLNKAIQEATHHAADPT
ncbi:MAG: hypothetical protein RL462_460 [Pseudomonadota bacterium]|jgi:hypothetical protein